ncbi:MAG: family 10 glycosylhydrolase, partial [Phycisphaerae bacterium]
HQQTGKHRDDDPQAWDHWRANQLTRLVGDIRARLEWRRPGATLTAAVWSNPQRGYREYLQDAVAWLRSGVVDAAMPMAYTAKLDEFESYIGAYQTLAPNARIIPGLGIYKHETAEQLGWQLERCRTWGGDFALFSYDALHATAGDRGKDGKSKLHPKKKKLRELRRRVVRSFTSQ